MAIDPSRDAFGEEVKAYDKNRKDVVEIVERDDGHIDYNRGVQISWCEGTAEYHLHPN